MGPITTTHPQVEEWKEFICHVKNVCPNSKPKGDLEEAQHKTRERKENTSN